MKIVTIVAIALTMTSAAAQEMTIEQHRRACVDSSDQTYCLNELRSAASTTTPPNVRKCSASKRKPRSCSSTPRSIARSGELRPPMSKSASTGASAAWRLASVGPLFWIITLRLGVGYRLPPAADTASSLVKERAAFVYWHRASCITLQPRMKPSRSSSATRHPSCRTSERNCPSSCVAVLTFGV
jgi:hypothetical protein